MINEEALEVSLNWIDVQLAEISEVVTGNTPSTKDKENYGSYLPFIKPPQLLNSVISDSDVSLSEKGIKTARVLPENSILVSCIGNLGKTAINKVEVASNQQINAIVPSTKLNPKFIFYQTQSTKFLHQLEENSSATTIPIVNKSKFEKLEISLCPINEQNRIVDKIETLFSEVDAGIENLTLAKRQLEQYRQSLLKHAFEGKLTAKWREEYAEKYGKSLPNADELLEQIQTARQDYYDQQIADWEQAVKDWEEQGKEGAKPRKPSKLYSVTDIDNMENLPTLPDGWRFHRLADIAEVGSGMSVSKNRKVDNPIEVNYLRVANVQRGYLDLDEIKTMIIDKFTFDRYKLLEGDILFNEGGDRDKLGRGWIWKNEVDNCITQNHVFRASTHIKNIAHSEFISHWGNTFGRDYFERTGKQTTNLASINKTVLSSFPVPYPSIEEQSLIVKLLNEKTSEVDNLVAELELQLKKATLLKTSILHKAFQGKLVPQDPKDPPASELLAQIKAEREAKALAEMQAKQDKAVSKSKAKTKSAKTPKKSKKDEQITLPL